MKVVLVGNAPYREEHRHGAFIDSCQEVIRFNNFEIAGHEPYVGTRTTIWCFQQNRWCVVKPRSTPYREILALIPQPVEPAPEFFRQIIGTAPCTRLLAHDCEQAFHAVGYWHGCGKCASSGAIAIWWALSRWPKVWLAGWDVLGRDSRHHYYSDEPPRQIFHDGELERQWIDDLRRRGLVHDLRRDGVPT